MREDAIVLCDSNLTEHRLHYCGYSLQVCVFGLLNSKYSDNANLSMKLWNKQRHKHGITASNINKMCDRACKTIDVMFLNQNMLMLLTQFDIVHNKSRFRFACYRIATLVRLRFTWIFMFKLSGCFPRWGARELGRSFRKGKEGVWCWLVIDIPMNFISFLKLCPQRWWSSNAMMWQFAPRH